MRPGEKNSGEVQTDEGHKFYYSGEDDRHANGVGFLVHKTIQSTGLGRQPISSRIITIRLRGQNHLKSRSSMSMPPQRIMTMNKLNSSTTRYRQSLTKSKKRHPHHARGLECKSWCRCSRRLGRLLRTLIQGRYRRQGSSLTRVCKLQWHGSSKHTRIHLACTKWPDSHPDRLYHVKNRYKSGVSRAKTRTFPGQDIGSDHDLDMMTFRVRLKGSKKAKNTRLKFNLDKLKDPNISSSFEARIGGKLGPLLMLQGDAEALTNNFNEVMTEVATDILGFSRPKTQSWATDVILNN